MLTKLMLATVIVLDYGTGWGSRMTECDLNFVSWSAVKDESYLYATCSDGEVINLPTEPTREALSIDEIIVTDGADPIERQNCGLVSDRIQSGSRVVTVSCGVGVFRDGFASGS